jgi:hypothetical protein
MFYVAVGIPVLLLALWVLSGYIPTRNIAMPSYTVVEKRRDYEIRRYEAIVIAETRQQSIGGAGGFNELFRYISGDNVRAARIPMTAPVLKSGTGGGEKIPMTAPVIKEGEGERGTIAFVMPPGAALADLPQPRSRAVTLKEVPPRTLAAVTFSGVADAAVIREKTELLLTALRRDGKTMAAAPFVALYNPPWTPPFMRRNEVLVELSES